MNNASALLPYIHLETVLLLPLLVMMLLVQISRSGESVHSRQYARMHTWGILTLFPVLAAGLGYALFPISPLLGVELAAGFTLALLHPVNALCFFVQMLFLRPWDLMPDNPIMLALPRILAGLCFFSWLLHPWRHARPSVRASRALVLLLAFSAWLFLSTFKAPNAMDSQIDWFNTYFRSLVVFIMCAFFIENETSVSEFKYTIMISISSMAALGLYQYFTVSQERLSAISMLDPNDLAALSVIAVPMVLAPVFSRSARFSERLIGAVFLSVCLLAIWYSQSRGAMLALIAQVAGFQMVRTLGRQRVLSLITLGGVAALYFFAMGSLQRKQEDLQASTESRKTYWKTAVNMTVRNPILGVGFDQFGDKYESYSPSLKIEWGRRAAHSSWLLAFAESGFLGGSLFVAFFLVVWKTAWRRRKETPDQLYALGGYGIAMSFLSHTYLPFPYMLYGLILASDSVKKEPALAA